MAAISGRYRSGRNFSSAREYVCLSGAHSDSYLLSFSLATNHSAQHRSRLFNKHRPLSKAKLAVSLTLLVKGGLGEGNRKKLCRLA